MGAVGEKLVKTLKRKIQSNLARKITIRIIYTTNKLSRFCGVKDSIPEDQQSNVIYSMKCPGCGEIYVGKTNCCFGKRMDEQGTRADQPLHQHLSKCSDFNYLVGLHNLPRSKGTVEVTHPWIRTFTKRSSKMPKSSQDQMTG